MPSTSINEGRYRLPASRSFHGRCRTSEVPQSAEASSVPPLFSASLETDGNHAIVCSPLPSSLGEEEKWSANAIEGLAHRLQLPDIVSRLSSQAAQPVI